MAKYYLNDRDRAIVADAIQRVGAGRGNNRPLARRRRHPIIAGASSSTKLIPALVFGNVSAATVDADEKTMTPGVSTTSAAWLLEQVNLDTGDFKFTVRQEDDPNAPEPPEGQEKPQIDVARRVINYAAAPIYASSVTPKLCHGFLQTLTVSGEDVAFFVAVEFIRNSVVNGVTATAVSGTSEFSASQFTTISGTAPTDATLTVQNDFGFEINAGGDFRAEQDDTGAWRLVQAECPV